jgi:hypothetical protein
MNAHICFTRTASLLGLIGLLATACSSPDDSEPEKPDACIDAGPGAVDTGGPDMPDGGKERRCPTLTPVFPTEANPAVTFEQCLFASPLPYEGGGGLEIIVASTSRVVSFAPETGQPNWTLELPAPEGETALVVATPAMIDDLLVLEYHTTPIDGTTREAHFVAVVDLAAGALHPDFELLTVDGTFDANDGQTIGFRPSNALGRAHLKHGRLPGDELGKVYVTYGNARDIQPWHGFAFEVDLDAWRAEGPAAAISGHLVTTPEADCGQAGVSGSRDRICGGGLWAPSGPLIVPRDDTYEVILAPGNGQLDLERSDYANTLMRVDPGLAFDPACDADACAGFDPDAPSPECLSSCRNLFVPRDDVGDPFPSPASGACDGLTMFECWARLDYIGGSTPVHVELQSGTRVLAYPTKDGAIYMVDADNLGTLYDREQLVEICGTTDDACRWDWAGMIVTQPAVTELDGRPLLLVPTFMPDTTHAAGVVALAIDDSSGRPQFEVLWTAPDFSTAEAVSRFRQHPTRITLQRVDDDLEVAWIAETFRRETARLLAIDVRDGAIIYDEPIGGPGMRFNKPLIVDETIYLNHCDEGGGPQFLEAFSIAYDE